jgi:hypothetical protein
LPAFAEALETAFDPIMADFRAKLDVQSATGTGGTFPPIAFAGLIDKLFSLAQQFHFVVRHTC